MRGATIRQKMGGEKRRVIFANKKLENDYKRLATSKHREEKRLYSVLKRIRTTLRRRYLSGTKFRRNKIPAIYKRLFHIDNLWAIKFSYHGTVLYSIVGNEIRIVDVP